MLGDISFGLFLAKLNRGGRVVLEQARINNEVWLPRAVYMKVGARLLVKKVNIEQENSYSDYKKFRVDSRVLSQ